MDTLIASHKKRFACVTQQVEVEVSDWTCCWFYSNIYLFSANLLLFETKVPTTAFYPFHYYLLQYYFALLNSEKRGDSFFLFIFFFKINRKEKIVHAGYWIIFVLDSEFEVTDLLGIT